MAGVKRLLHLAVDGHVAVIDRPTSSWEIHKDPEAHRAQPLETSVGQIDCELLEIGPHGRYSPGIDNIRVSVNAGQHDIAAGSGGTAAATGESQTAQIEDETCLGCDCDLEILVLLDRLVGRVGVAAW